MRVVALDVNDLMQLESYDLEFPRESYEIFSVIGPKLGEGHVSKSNFELIFSKKDDRFNFYDQHKSCR